ncbi:MAG: hypothetical protein U1D66_14940 [Erythrobacter sp.]|nr:hypothetical protein [Erythrobacter sp.]
MLILSSEYIFPGMRQGELTAMRDGLRGMTQDIVPFIYIREPAGFYASACQQDVRMGRDMRGPGPIMLRARLEALIKVFGEAKLRSFARSALEGGDILVDFVTHGMGRPDLLDRITREDANHSVSAEACAILQIFRQHVAPERRGLPDPYANALTDVIEIIEAEQGLENRARLKPDVARKVRQCSVDYGWLRKTHGLSFAELDYEALEKTMAEPQAALLDGGVEEIFEVDTTIRDQILAALMLRMLGFRNTNRNLMQKITPKRLWFSWFRGLGLRRALYLVLRIDQR